MEFIHQEVAREYERWLDLAGSDDPYRSSRTMGLHDVLRAHFLIVDFFMENKYGIGGIGPKSLDLLHSAIYRQFISFEGTEKWSSDCEKCATLLFGLVKDHPFHDANKRTALLVALYHLDRVGRTPEISQKQLEDFIVEIADNRLEKYSRYRELREEDDDAEVQFIADFLKRHTRQIDRRPYTVTYHQLNSLLQKHGFELVNPYHNHIELVRVEWAPKFLGIVGPTVRKEIRIANIGFPGWKKQVARGDIKKIREAAELTAARGYDSAVFYKDADPLHSLIDIYAEPLRRLADR
jgi:death-on-curing family protein